MKKTITIRISKNFYNFLKNLSDELDVAITSLTDYLAEMLIFTGNELKKEIKKKKRSGQI